jgi:hypothetical protein
MMQSKIAIEEQDTAGIKSLGDPSSRLLNKAKISIQAVVDRPIQNPMGSSKISGTNMVTSFNVSGISGNGIKGSLCIFHF